MGVFFFRQIKSGDSINDYMNFSNFAMAFLMLFRMSTGEDWNIVMYDCAASPEGCEETGTCGSKWAPAYFIAFQMVVCNIMLNLFVLVILEQFDKYYLPKDNIIAKFKIDL